MTKWLNYALIDLLFSGYSHYQWQCLEYECKIPDKHYTTPFIKDLSAKDILRDLLSKLIFFNPEIFDLETNDGGQTRHKNQKLPSAFLFSPFTNPFIL